MKSWCGGRVLVDRPTVLSTLLILIATLQIGCAVAPKKKVYYTPKTVAPTTQKVKTSVNKAYKSSVRIEDHRSRIEFKATRILERWSR